jgi:hypothetical protein
MPHGAHLTFSQCGEDRICKHLFDAVLRIDKPSFFDIGANDPILMNNTYLLSRTGSSGVLVEPDESLASIIRARRPKDFCLNVGISDGTGPSGATRDFYVFEVPALNTFSKLDADASQKSGFRLARVAPVALIDVNTVLRERFDRCPNFVSLDAEGFDEKILATWDFDLFRPDVFCVETINFNTRAKRGGIFDLMRAARYTAYADTFLNTIFVSDELWPVVIG